MTVWDLAIKDNLISRRHGEAGAASWAHVLNHFALNEGFALMILVVPDQVASNLCRREIGAWLGRQGRRVVDLSPDDPAALRRLAPTLLEQPDSADLGCVWFGAAHAENRTAWEDAWRWGLGTLNQHRNSLRERFACTVVIAGPPWLVPLFRDMAPDLWSVRTVVAWIETDTNRIAGDFELTTKQTRKPSGLLDGRSRHDLSLALDALRRLREGRAEPRRLAEMLDRVGYGYLSADICDRAEEAFREAYGILEPYADSVEAVEAIMGLGRAVLLQHRFAEAELLFRRALARTEQDDSMTVHRTYAISALGQAVFDQDRLPEAEVLFRQALVLAQRLAFRTLEVDILEMIGIAVADQGRPAEAEPLFRQALTLKESLGYSPLSRAGTIGLLGCAVRDQRRLVAAEMLFRQALALREDAGENPLDRAHAMEVLAYTIGFQGRLDEAEAVMAHALELRRQANDPPE
jgi:tetratricopeptide (TPR) repeat protein